MFYLLGFIPLQFSRVITLLILLALSAYPQYFTITNYGIESGLITRDIFDITQDSTGRLWFATGRGVSVYDGFSYTHFGTTEGYAISGTRKVLLDSTGSIWAIPQQLSSGIYYYKNSAWQQYPQPDTSLYNRYTEVIDAALWQDQGTVRVCLATVYALYVGVNGAWQRFPLPGGRPQMAYHLYPYKGYLYLATELGLFRYRAGAMEPVPGIPYRDIIAVTVRPRSAASFAGEMLYLGKNYVAAVRNGRFTRLCSFKPLMFSGSNEFISFTADTRSRIFFSTKWEKYVYFERANRVQPMFIANGFTSNGATATFIDREGVLWSAITRGVDKVPSFRFRNYDAQTGLWDNEVTALLRLKSGQIIYGHNTGITLQTGNSFKHISFEQYLNSGVHCRVLDLMQDASGTVFISASQLGLGEFNPATGSLRFYLTGPKTYVNMAAPLAPGKLLVATNTGIKVFHNQSFSQYQKQPDAPYTIRKLASGPDGERVFVSTHGLLRETPDGIIQAYNDADFSRMNLFTYYYDEELGELVGSAAGLFTLVNGKLHPAALDGTVIDNAVYALLKDSRGALWVGTNDGVFVYKPGEGVRHLTFEDGLAGREINRSALVEFPGNEVWVGTDAGVSVYSQADDQMPIPKPLIYVAGLEAFDGTRYSLAGAVALDAAQNSFAVRFRGCSYMREESLVYEYMLEGADQNWVRATQAQIREIRYTNLAPGSYRLKVRVQNPYGAWSDYAYSGIITVAAPFYRQWWFILITLVLILSAVIVGNKFYLDRTYTDSLEHEVALQTEQLRESHNLLREAAIELESRVAQRTSQLEAANAQLQKDIELREQAERDLRDSEEKYFTLFNTAGEPILMVDAETQGILAANLAAAELYGYSQQELAGMTIAAIFSQPADAPGFSADQNTQVNRSFHKKRNGDVFPVELVNAFLNQRGKSLCISIIRDISRRMEEEEQQRLYAERLQNLNDNKDMFFSIIAHDLKSPFHGLLGLSTMLRDEFNELNRHEKLEMIITLQKLSKRSYQLIENLLEWSRLQRDSMLVAPATFLVQPALKSVVELYESSLITKKITVSVEADPSLAVYADERMFGIILQNLVSNAVKFSHPGGKILVRAEAHGNAGVLCTVRDAGAGMSPDELAAIFKIEVRKIRKGTAGEEGTGLGLQLVAEMVKRNNGAVWAESEKGEGSAFFVVLPAVAGASVTRPPAVTQSGQTASGAIS